MPANHNQRGSLTDGALAPLLGRLQREKSSGWLRLSAMEVRDGAPVVTRCALRLVRGRLALLEEEDAARLSGRPVSVRGQELEARAASALAHFLRRHDGVVAWEPDDAASEPDLQGPALAHVVRSALDRLSDPAAVLGALGPSARALFATPSGGAEVGPITAAQTALLGRAAAGVTASELVSHATDPVAAERDLLLLLAVGLVSWAEPGAAPGASPRAATQAPSPARPASAPSVKPSPPATRAATLPPPRPAAPARPAPPPPAPPRETAAELRRDVEQAHAGLRGATHFQVLGLTVEASEADVRQAFARLARRYHPDAQSDPTLADLRPKLSDLFVAINNAYGVLKDPTTRDRYERAMSLRPSAPAREGVSRPARPAATTAPSPGSPDEPLEARILRSEEALGAGQPWEAIRLLEEALPAAVGPLKTRVRVLLGRAYAERDRPREAEKVLLAAHQEDPKSAAACLALGRLYRDRGMVKRARGMFEKALEIDPRQGDARRELAALGEEPPDNDGGGGSLLSRLRDRR